MFDEAQKELVFRRPQEAAVPLNLPAKLFATQPTV
jgi:hypothetical protein